MFRKLQNFLFGRLSGNSGQFYNGVGQFISIPHTYKLGITIDGAGSAISTGLKGYTSVPETGTILRARMLADQTGSAVVDIWKDTWANYPPVNADSITAAAPPTISADDNSEDTTLSGWTVAVTQGDVLGFNVDSASTITRLTVELWILVTT